MMGLGGISLIILIVAVVFLVKYIYPGNSNDQKNIFRNKENALDVLKRRFANGEISKEEYEEKKHVLL
ncbi:MAG: SHOCT domain-containing protein [Ignavibacteriaceae bacterium]